MTKLVRWLKSLFKSPYKLSSRLPEPAARLSFVFDIDVSRSDTDFLVGDKPTVTILPRNDVGLALVGIANDEVLNALVNVISVTLTDSINDGRLLIVKPVFKVSEAGVQTAAQTELLN